MQALADRLADNAESDSIRQLAGVVLKNAAPDTAAGRAATARTLGESEAHARLLVDLSVVFVDNGRASEAQLAAMHAVLSAMPAQVWDVEVIGVGSVVDRSGGDPFGDVGLPLTALAKVQARTWSADDVPDEFQGSEPVKPGSRPGA